MDEFLRQTDLFDENYNFDLSLKNFQEINMEKKIEKTFCRI